MHFDYYWSLNNSHWPKYFIQNYWTNNALNRMNRLGFWRESIIWITDIFPFRILEYWGIIHIHKQTKLNWERIILNQSKTFSTIRLLHLDTLKANWPVLALELFFASPETYESSRDMEKEYLWSVLLLIQTQVKPQTNITHTSAGNFQTFKMFCVHDIFWIQCHVCNYAYCVSKSKRCQDTFNLLAFVSRKV